MFKASLKTPQVLNIEHEFQFNKQLLQEDCLCTRFLLYFKTSKKIMYFSGKYFFKKIKLISLKVVWRAAF